MAAVGSGFSAGSIKGAGVILQHVPGANILRRDQFLRFPKMCWIQIPHKSPDSLTSAAKPPAGPSLSSSSSHSHLSSRRVQPPGKLSLFLRQGFCYFHGGKNLLCLQGKNKHQAY